ncbi:MAG: hypothetical protein ACRCXT_03570 [Paraclostridium sp.]
MENKNETRINYNLHYPYSPDYYYESRVVRVDLDKKREESILTGRGFIVNKVQSNLKKDLKNPDGIYSPKFGQTLDDVNPFMDKYKCECGAVRSRFNEGITCYVCNTTVKYVDDDFGYFGWITLKDPYCIIHPNLYKALYHLCGKDTLLQIIKPVVDKDINGYIRDHQRPKDEPFLGIGMMELRDRIDEVLEFYVKKYPNKREYYEDLVANKEKIFTQSIPVYTIHLRPYKLDGIKFNFEDTNKLYNIMAKLSVEINNDRIKAFRNKVSKNKLLFDLQENLSELYMELENILSGKKGLLRSVCGGRCSFTSRDVIVANPSLRIDEVVMPYAAMVELLQQTIINVLQKSYNTSPAEAYNIWERSQRVKDERVYQIIKGLINNNPRGIPVLINRNPTIAYGGILQMYVVDIVDNYTLGLPLQILPLLAADFDGDVLNVLYIINKDFYESASRVLNPRNAFYISRNDGRLSTDVIPNKDTLINANSMVGLARRNYSQDQLNKIKMAQNVPMIS